MRIRNWPIGVLLATSTLLFSACGEKAPPAVQAAPKISAVTAEQKTVPLVKEFVGEVLGKADIPIRARVDGYLEKIHFREGRRVKKGQLLYSIDDQPFREDVNAAESQVAEARVHAANANNELQRYEPLIKIKAVSQSDYDAAKSNKEAADESVKAAEAALELAKIKLGYCSIKSPIDGVIGKTEAEVGEYVGRSPNPVILNTVSQIDSIRVQFFLTESDYLAIARENLEERENTHEEPNPRHDSDLRLILSDGSQFPEKGTVDFINRNIDQATGAILIQTSFANPQGLIRPGQFAKVRANMDVLENSVLVPQRCVMETQGQYAVYIIQEDNTVTRTKVVLGPTYLDYYVVLEGVLPTDKIALDGLQRMRDGMTVDYELKAFNSQFPSNE